MATPVIPDGFKVVPTVPDGFKVVHPRQEMLSDNGIVPTGLQKQIDISNEMLRRAKIAEAKGETPPPVPLVEYPYVPEPMPQVQPSFADAFLEAAGSRGTAQMVGGTVGSIPGVLTANPVAAILGGGVGAGLGDKIYSNVTGQPSQTIETMQTDMAIGAGLGAGAAAYRATKRGVGSLIGVRSEDALKVRDMAERLGVPVGAIQTTEKEALKGFSKVIGVFPFVGTPIKRAQAASRVALNEKFEGILNSIAPNATLADTGVDLTRAAGKEFQAFKNTSGALYEEFERQAKNLSKKDIFPSSATVEAAKRIAGEQTEVTLKNGGSLKNLQSDPIGQFVSALQELPDNLTIEQVRSVQRQLQDAMGKAAADGYDVARGIEIKKALEQDMMRPYVDLLNYQEAKSLTDALRNANAFYSSNIQRFQNVTANKFGRIDRNFFKPKFEKAGSLNPDEAFKAVFNSKSPNALQDLKGIVGRKTFNQAARQHVEQMFEKSIVTTDKGGVLDADKFISNLGLDTPQGRDTLMLMLEGTAATPRQLEDFARVLKAVDSVPIGDTSTFVQRRAMLGGAGSMLKGLTIGGAVAGTAAVGGAPSLPVMAGVALLGRKASSILSSPEALKQMTTVLDPTAQEIAKRSALIRLVRTVGDKEEQKEVQEALKMNGI